MSEERIECSIEWRDGIRIRRFPSGTTNGRRRRRRRRRKRVCEKPILGELIELRCGGGRGREGMVCIKEDALITNITAAVRMKEFCVEV